MRLGPPRLWIPAALLAAVVAGHTPALAAPAARQEAAPRILLDTSPKAVEYQLSRLNNADLVRVERRQDDPRYRPVFMAILTRKGLGREYFEEALTALTRLDKASRTSVLLEGLSRVPPADDEAAERLLRVLLSGPPESLTKERDLLQAPLETASSPWVLQASYGGMMLADGSPDSAWRAAASREGHLRELLRSVPHLAPSAPVRSRLVDPVAGLLEESQEAPTRAAALTALASIRPDAATFGSLARELTGDPDPVVRAAAIQALSRIPPEARPAAEVEPVVRALIAQVQAAPPKLRTEPAVLDAMQAADRLAEGLPEETRRGMRRELRALGVRVVRIEAVPEQMLFDRRWFVAEAGKPVQIVLYNPDAMAHNLLVVMPGALEEVGIAASTMPLPADPAVKPYVPDSPLVLHATRLLNWGETERLGFIAPEEPGDYVYVCTFPGHWVRMYGVMRVVKDLEAWEANPTVPVDPMTQKPYASERH